MNALFLAKVKLTVVVSAGALTLGVGAPLAMAMKEGPESVGGEKAASSTPRILEFDRAKLHAQAVEESLKPVRPGIPGKVPFWNSRASSFIYAPAFDYKPVPGAVSYRFTVKAYGSKKKFAFEADNPWASLAPVWTNMPVGRATVSVEGLDKKGGRRIGPARIRKTTTRKFERRAAFNGPYHEAAIDYIEAGKRWLNWLVGRCFKKFEKERKIGGGYPCKNEVTAVKAFTVLASLEDDAAKKNKLLQMARNAARTLIKGSFPADWGLAYCPPTYGVRGEEGKGETYSTVMMKYPASAGNVYIDLYEATKEKEFLDAAVRVAEIYRKTQLPNGTWHLLMEGRSGEKTPRSETFVAPLGPIGFFERLIGDHGLATYQPMLLAARKYVEDDMLVQFRFEGQFEDTGNAGGAGLRVKVSHHTADAVFRYLVRYSKDNPSYVSMADEVRRWSEDQFVFWETPPKEKKTYFTPRAREQHTGNVTIQGGCYSTDASAFMAIFQTVYEMTGRELYLAKAVAFANAMTALQEKCGGDFVCTAWGKTDGWGNWPNCHAACAMRLIKFGRMLEERNMRVPVNPDANVKSE